MLEQAVQIVAVCVSAAWLLRLPETAYIVAHHAVVLREGLPLLIPHAAIANARVDQDQRMALPRNFVIEPCILHVHPARSGTCAFCHCAVTPNTKRPPRHSARGPASTEMGSVAAAAAPAGAA